jgi:hypothetical protein
VALKGLPGSHEWARAIVNAAWRQVFGRDPSETEAQGVQAVASLETNYGRGQGRNNWGSVHASGGDCTSGTDTDAGGKRYTTCFKNYASPQAGAVDLIRTMVKPNVAGPLRSGSASRVARAMHANRYFELDPSAYAERIEARAKIIAGALGEAWTFRRTNAFLGLLALGAVAGGGFLWYRKGYTHV